MIKPDAKSAGLFPLGVLLATPQALRTCNLAGADIATLIHRHATGDFGELCSSDLEQNAKALKSGARIFSSYLLKTGEKIWVITEAADEYGRRASTTALTPDQY